MDTMQPKEIKEVNPKKDELVEELKLKKEQLADKKARLEGTKSPLLKRDYLSIDKEIERMQKAVSMREIEVQKDAPINPKYMFEQDDRWREMKRSFAVEELEQFRKQVEILKEQKEQILKDVEELTVRVAELEKSVSPQP